MNEGETMNTRLQGVKFSFEYLANQCGRTTYAPMLLARNEGLCMRKAMYFVLMLPDNKSVYYIHTIQLGYYLYTLEIRKRLPSEDSLYKSEDNRTEFRTITNNHYITLMVERQEISKKNHTYSRFYIEPVDKPSFSLVSLVSLFSFVRRLFGSKDQE
jgi:hypothetical protein